MTRRLSTLCKALLGSFAVYLVPLVGPHAVWLLGEQLLRELTRAAADHPIAWIAADVGLAVAVQGLVAALLYRFFARPSAPGLGWIAVAAVLLWPTLQWAYLVAIPERFLIEADEALERLEWPTECFVADVALAAVRTPADLPLERAGRAWVAAFEGLSYGILEACRVIPVVTAASPAITVPFVLADGHSLHAVWERATGQNQWLQSAAIDGALTALARPRPIRIVSFRSSPTTGNGPHGSSPFPVRPPRRSPSR